jgi:hypothetical protein
VDQYEIIGKVREYFNQDEDARITFFSKCIPVLDSLTLCLMLRKYNLQDDFWWNDMHMSSFAPLHERYVNVSLQNICTWTNEVWSKHHILDSINACHWSSVYAFIGC